MFFSILQLTYAKWWAGETPDYDCVGLRPGSDGDWAKYRCTEAKPYICERFKGLFHQNT